MKELGFTFNLNPLFSSKGGAFDPLFMFID